MDRVTDLVPAPGPVKLGDDDRGSGGEAHEKAYQQIDQSPGRPSHGSQGFLSHKPPHNDGIHSVV